jgi:hypothetical protein
MNFSTNSHTPALGGRRVKSGNGMRGVLSVERPRLPDGQGMSNVELRISNDFGNKNHTPPGGGRGSRQTDNSQHKLLHTLFDILTITRTIPIH